MFSLPKCVKCTIVSKCSHCNKPICSKCEPPHIDSQTCAYCTNSLPICDEFIPGDNEELVMSVELIGDDRERVLQEFSDHLELMDDLSETLPEEAPGADRAPTITGPKTWLSKSPLVFQSITLACCMAPWFSVASFLPQLRERYEVSPAEASVLQIMSLLGFMLFGTVSSLLQVADRFPPHLQCSIGAAVSGLFNLLFLLTPPWLLLLLFRLVVGGAVSIVYPTAMKVSGSWKPAKARGFAMGVMIGAICVGTSLPQLLAGFSPNWKLNVVLASCFCFVGSILSFFVFRRGPFPFPSAKFQPSQVGRLLKTPAVLLVMFSYLGHNWELFAVWSWIGSFFRAMADDDKASSQSLSLSPVPFTSTSTGASLLAFAVIATGLFGAVGAGWLADRYGRVLTCIAAASLSWLCSLLIGPASLLAPGLAVGVGLVWGGTVIADSAQYSALMSEVCDQSLVGTALTVQLALGFVSGLPVVYLMPLVAEAISWTWAFVLCSVGPVISLPCLLLLGHRQRKAAAAARG